MDKIGKAFHISSAEAKIWSCQCVGYEPYSNTGILIYLHEETVFHFDLTTWAKIANQESNSGEYLQLQKLSSTVEVFPALTLQCSSQYYGFS